MIRFILNLFGISLWKLGMYAAIVAIAFGAWVGFRQHYINVGWDRALAAVKKQDDKARAAARVIERRAAECSQNSFWDVVTASCRGDEQ